MNAPDCVMRDSGIGKMLLITTQPGPVNQDFKKWIDSLPEWEKEFTPDGWRIDRKHLIYLVNYLPEWFEYPVWRTMENDCVLRKAVRG
jgi:hypothetical protein